MLKKKLKPTTPIPDKITMRHLLIIFSALLFTSCAGLKNNRSPAEVVTSTCTDLAKSIFLSESNEKNLEKALTERKLISLQEKFIVVQHPRLDWINKVKISFNQSLRNWNNNRYPAFYLFSEEEILPMAKRYAENLERIATNQVPLNDEETTKAFVSVSDWIKAYKNYQTDIDQLIEERISLQYNVSLLKKLKLGSEPRDVQINIKRAGVLQNEIITLRKEDKNLTFTINKLKQEIKELDGTLLKNGKIKDRIIRQAMLQDMLAILQREMEYASKNGFESEVLIKETGELSALLKQTEFTPVTYGVYKIQDKVFIRELLNASKIDLFYNKIKEPVFKLKSVLSDFFKNRKAGTDEEKIGILKRLYAKITSITPKQAAVAGGTIAVAGIGTERYFWFKEKNSIDLKDQTKSKELGPEDQAHLQQLDNTEKVEVEKLDAHSQVVEVSIEELTK